jgi:hypothetical protein
MRWSSSVPYVGASFGLCAVKREGTALWMQGAGGFPPPPVPFGPYPRPSPPLVRVDAGAVMGLINRAGG